MTPETRSEEKVFKIDKIIKKEIEAHRITPREGGEDLDREIEDGEETPTTPRHINTPTHQNTANKPTQFEPSKPLINTNTLDPPPPPETNPATPLKTSRITTSNHTQGTPGEERTGASIIYLNI
jgi:hypothetical protein